MLVINNRLVDLLADNKLSRHIKGKVQWMKENLSENGKDVVFVWDDSKQKKALHSRTIRGYSQGEYTTPQGHILNMFALSPVFQEEGEGLSDVVYLRRSPQQDNGLVVNLKRDKELFTGRIVVNLSRQPDLAFFLYFCCPQCRGGGNANGSNVFKVQNREADATRRNEQIRIRARIQTLTVNKEAQGGLSSASLAEFAERVLRNQSVDKLTPERLREFVHDECIKSPEKAAALLNFAEQVVEEAPLPPPPSKEPEPVIEDDIEDDDDSLSQELLEDDFDLEEESEEELVEEPLEELPIELPVIPVLHKPSPRTPSVARKSKKKRGATKK